MNDKTTQDAALAASADCGCAPTPAERRTLFRDGISRRGALGLGALSVVALSAFGISSGVTAAHAASYPSWDDVQKAKQNEASKAAEVKRIEGLIQSLTQKVSETQAAAEVASTEFYNAQQAYFAAIAEADSLQEKADAQAAVADESARKAGQVAAQLYRNGGDDTSLELFFADSAANADELLARLGSMDKLLEYNKTVYNDAVAARNSAQSLSDQAVVARDERDRLQKIAEEKMVAAQQAADAAQAALDEQSSNLATMQAQLAALKDTTATTVAGYQKGVEEREKERKRREAAEAAANAGGNSGGGGTPGSGGWVRPHGGYRSSGYGPARSSATPTAARRAGTTASTSPTAAARRSTQRTRARWTRPSTTAGTATTSGSSTAAASPPDTRISSPAASPSGTASGCAPARSSRMRATPAVPSGATCTSRSTSTAATRTPSTSWRARASPSDGRLDSGRPRMHGVRGLRFDRLSDPYEVSNSVKVSHP